MSNLDEDLLVFSGDLDKKNIGDLFFLVEKIYNHNFLNKLIGGVYYDYEQGYILSSKICDLGIRIGPQPKLDREKINMIKVFFNFLSTELNCEDCKLIDIQYAKQVICVK